MFVRRSIPIVPYLWTPSLQLFEVQSKRALCLLKYIYREKRTEMTRQVFWYNLFHTPFHTCSIPYGTRDPFHTLWNRKVRDVHLRPGVLTHTHVLLWFCCRVAWRVSSRTLICQSMSPSNRYHAVASRHATWSFCLRGPGNQGTHLAMRADGRDTS